jgi:hypothetical protein
MLNHDTASSRVVLRVARIMALLLCIGAMTVATPAPASADPEHGLRNVATQLCLASQEPHAIYTQTCFSGYGPHLWHHHAGRYAYRVMNYTTGVCLDSNASGEVYGNPCTDYNAYQEWRITSNTFGAQLRNVATGRCLDSNTNEDVYTYPCNDGNFQRWRTR